MILHVPHALRPVFRTTPSWMRSPLSRPQELQFHEPQQARVAYSRRCRLSEGERDVPGVDVGHAPQTPGCFFEHFLRHLEPQNALTRWGYPCEQAAQSTSRVHHHVW